MSSQEQFSQIYDKYVDKIYRFIFLKVNSQETSEDLTTKVFIKGWEKFKQNSKEIKNPSSYLYQIAKTEIADYYRQKSKFKIVSKEINQEILDRITDSRTNVEEDLILRADIELVWLALDQLKNDYQDLIIWRYLDELEIKEIAELMAKPEGTIRVMLHRALQELREKIESL